MVPDVVIVEVGVDVFVVETVVVGVVLSHSTNDPLNTIASITAFNVPVTSSQTSCVVLRKFERQRIA